MDWTNIIGAGLQYLGSKKAAGAQTDAASQYNQAMIEASKPISVYDPMSSASYDDETKQYSLGLSPQQQGLFNAYLGDIYRQRALVEPYMRDPEAAARKRYAETTAAITPGREAATETLLSRLNKGGLLGSTVGAGMAAQVDTQRAVEDAQRMGLARSGVQSDITNYLNRANNARSGMLGIGALPQSLASIGTGLGSTYANAVATGGQPLMNAQAQQGLASGMFPYTLGTQLMGYDKQPPPRATYNAMQGRPTSYNNWAGSSIMDDPNMGI